MQFSFKLKIGNLEFTFSDTASNVKEFFEKVSVFSDLPSKGPNGEDDLRISHRTTKKGYEYYSIICDSSKMEYKFGQTRDSESLYPKGWEPLFNVNGEEESEEIETLSKAAVPTPSNPPQKISKPIINKPNLSANTANQNTSDSVKNVLAKYGITK